MRKSYLLYLSYFNDFLSASSCAEYWGISDATMNRIIRAYQSTAK